jgi:hypothetical protein
MDQPYDHPDLLFLHQAMHCICFSLSFHVEIYANPHFFVIEFFHSHDNGNRLVQLESSRLARILAKFSQLEKVDDFAHFRFVRLPAARQNPLRSMSRIIAQTNKMQQERISYHWLHRNENP